MKYRKFAAFIISASLTAGMFGACGQPQSDGGTSGASSSSSGPSSSTQSEDRSSSGTYLSAALDIIETAGEICEAGAEAADQLKQATADLYNLTQDETADSVTGIMNEEEYIAYSDTQLENVTDEREKLTDLSKKLEQVSFAGDDVLENTKDDLADIFDQMDGTFSEMEKLVAFFRDSNKIYTETLSDTVASYDENDMNGYLDNIILALKDLQSEYRNMDKPEQLREIWDKNADNMDLFATSMNYLSNYNYTDGAQLYYYCFNQMNDYNSAVEASYTNQLLNVIQNSYEWDSSMFGKTYKKMLNEVQESCGNGTAPSKENLYDPDPEFKYDIVKEIYPNRYPTMDSVVNLIASTTVPEQDVIISVEIPGFTQPYEQKVTLDQQTSYFMIKPALLADLPDLSTRLDMQLNFKITDNETGKTLVQESRDIVLYSIYDFFIETDEFGSASVFDLLGWLRPESDAVDAVNRQAVSYLESATGVGMLTGYSPSYSENPDVNTLIQVAAIQKAISDLGIRYAMDPYSFSGAQHILTPDQVVARQTGLCIESSLLMASCLMKCNLHPLIILTPGHAQVAIETYAGPDGSSGNYYLIETTEIPYEGFSVTENGLDPGSLVVNISDPSPSWWNDFLVQNSTEDGYPFIIDCNLRSVMHIQGLENIQADIDIEPVEYDSSEIPQTGENTGDSTDTSGGEEEAEYTTTTNNDGDLTIIVKADAEVSNTDNIIIVHPVAGASVPVMNVVRIYDTDTDTYFANWIDSLSESGYAVELPTDISSKEFDSLTFYYIYYYTIGDNDVYYQNMVAAVPLTDGSLAVFELIAEDGDDTGIDILNDAFATALYSFT